MIKVHVPALDTRVCIRLNYTQLQQKVYTLLSYEYSKEMIPWNPKLVGTYAYWSSAQKTSNFVEKLQAV